MCQDTAEKAGISSVPFEPYPGTADGGGDLPYKEGG